MIYLELFYIFLKIGAFTFGGGYAMLPLIQETVLRNGWLDQKQLIDFIAVSESTPGPFAVNISTYIGERTAGLPGALCATLGVVLPSFIIILIIARCYQRFCRHWAVKGCMEGLRPAVIALIATAVLSVGNNVFDITVIFTEENLTVAAIVMVASVMAYKKQHPIMIICISGILGVIAGLIMG